MLVQIDLEFIQIFLLQEWKPTKIIALAEKTLTDIDTAPSYKFDAYAWPFNNISVKELSKKIEKSRVKKY